MSYFDGLPQNVAGVVLVGAEGCAETADERWLRDATEGEEVIFRAYVKLLVAVRDGKEAASKFDVRSLYVDSNNRPYWLKAVLDTPNTPQVAVEKSKKFTRCLRIHCDW